MHDTCQMSGLGDQRGGELTASHGQQAADAGAQRVQPLGREGPTRRTSWLFALRAGLAVPWPGVAGAASRGSAAAHGATAKKGRAYAARLARRRALVEGLPGRLAEHRFTLIVAPTGEEIHPIQAKTRICPFTYSGATGPKNTC